MSPLDVARIVERRLEPDFATLLRVAGPEFADEAFEVILAETLRSHSWLIEQWRGWSADQRWTPAACIDGTTTGWVPAGGGQMEQVREHVDDAAAVADLIHRTAAWSARR